MRVRVEAYNAVWLLLLVVALVAYHHNINLQRGVHPAGRSLSLKC